MPDALIRCSWATSAPEYLAYHDDEWGRPLHGDRELFERMSLEAFQSGLSWLIILRKREGFRSAFASFDIPTVAGYDESDVERLLADAAIVRNRSKIEATIGNARRILDAVPEGLDALLWSYAPTQPRPRPKTLADLVATSPESVAMAKDLKKRGFKFVGPTTAYALMQATGMVDDHVATCWRAKPAKPASGKSPPGVERPTLLTTTGSCGDVAALVLVRRERQTTEDGAPRRGERSIMRPTRGRRGHLDVHRRLPAEHLSGRCRRASAWRRRRRSRCGGRR